MDGPRQSAPTTCCARCWHPHVPGHEAGICPECGARWRLDDPWTIVCRPQRRVVRRLVISYAICLLSFILGVIAGALALREVEWPSPPRTPGIAAIWAIGITLCVIGIRVSTRMVDELTPGCPTFLRVLGRIVFFANIALMSMWLLVTLAVAFALMA